jgi:hypothetical protein
MATSSVSLIRQALKMEIIDLKLKSKDDITADQLSTPFIPSEQIVDAAAIGKSLFVRHFII